MALVELKTDLRSLRSEFFTDRKPYVSTNLPADFNAPSPKTPNTLELAAERRQDDVSRLTQLLASGRGATFLSKQALLSFKESGKISQALRNVAAQIPTLIGQTAASGTGLHLSADIITGNTYLPVNTSYLKRSVLIPDNKFNGEEILKGIPSSEAPNKGQTSTNLRAPVDVGYKFGNVDKLETPTQALLSYQTDSQQLFVSTNVTDPYDGTSTTEGVRVGKGPTALKNPNNFGVKESLGRTASIVSRAKENAKTYLDNSKEIKLKMGVYGGVSTRGTTQAIDGINYLEVTTKEIDKHTDIIPFKIAVFEPGKAPTYLYFRAYLESLGDNFSGDWNSTKYIGRAESVFNYTGFKRDISFAFKIAANTEHELLPLYQKINHLVGTTAPSYSNTFMRGVFVELTIGDYLKKVPGFFNSVNLTWDKSYPWEVKEETFGTYKHTPSVPHILDISLSFTPIHQFTPEIAKPFITDEITIEARKLDIPIRPLSPAITVPEDIPAVDNIVDFDNITLPFSEDIAGFEGVYTDWVEVNDSYSEYQTKQIEKRNVERQRRLIREQGGAFGNTPQPFAPALNANTPTNVTLSPDELRRLDQQRRRFSEPTQLPTVFR